MPRSAFKHKYWIHASLHLQIFFLKALNNSRGTTTNLLSTSNSSSSMSILSSSYFVYKPISSSSGQATCMSFTSIIVWTGDGKDNSKVILPLIVWVSSSVLCQGFKNSLSSQPWQLRLTAVGPICFLARRGCYTLSSSAGTAPWFLTYESY